MYCLSLTERLLVRACCEVAEAGGTARRFARKNRPRILKGLARKANALMADFLKGKTYYWITEQAEFATDVMFENLASHRLLYEELAKHSTLCFSADDTVDLSREEAPREPSGRGPDALRGAVARSAGENAVFCQVSR